MSGSAPIASSQQEEKIRVLVVDDIEDTRDQIKKLLTFEQDIEVVGTAGNGIEAIEKAKSAHPHIILMDINMPDMDGIAATEQIATAVPTAAVVMMSVQSEADYLRRAMLAGASDFLTKPVSGDDLYSTLRKVYERKKAVIQTLPVAPAGMAQSASRAASMGIAEKRLGQILVIYSPKGGAGCTMIATNLAAGMMREGLKVLLVDADTQFGDVGVFLNLKSQTNLSDLVAAADDLDMELVENVLATHDSGLRVLLSPDPVPENLMHVFDSDAVADVIEKIAVAYDIIIVDTSSRIDALNAALFDIASRIMLICPPTLAGVKNVRAVLRLFDESDYPPDKSLLVINNAIPDRGRSGRVSIDTALIEKNLKLSALAEIPMEERVVLHAVNRGVPVVAISKDRNRSPIKELLDLAEQVRHILVGEEEEAAEDTADDKKDTGGLGWFRRG